MSIGLPFWQRSLLVLTIAAVLFVPAYRYLESHDVARTVREFTGGKKPTWPPAPKQDKRGGIGDLVGDFGGRLVAPARGVALLMLGVGGLLTASRLAHRHRRAGETATYELELSRDDLSNPYRVQRPSKAYSAPSRPVGTSAPGAARTTSRSKSTGCETTWPTSPSRRRAGSSPRSPGRLKTSTPTSG
jgi:hypothetical protein